MIIEGNPAGSVGFWSKHLLRDDTNELAEIREISGLSATDLAGALNEMKAVASGSRSRGNFMYQANINPLAHEHLTTKQWAEAINLLEKNLGLQGHQRVVVEHIKGGRQHFHIVWNRVDIETMKVADMRGNWKTHAKTARELERQFGLEPALARTAQQRGSNEELWEKRAAERSGIDPKAVRTELTQLWRTTDTGVAFKAAIEDRGYILARGDRRDFCVVDRAGDPHSLAKRIDGAKTADVRARMADIDRAALPTVAAAREKQRARFPRAKSGVHQKLADAKRESVALRESAAKRHNVGQGQSAKAIDSVLYVAAVGTGTIEKLTDFVANLLGGGGGKKLDPNAPRSERMDANRRAAAALKGVRESVEQGKTLRPEDLYNLAPEHLAGIEARGDDYIRDTIRITLRDRERERNHERTHGRERER